ncbi:MAG: putative oxidoreductase [Solirubrobacteraceae bacterium]|nr:putative oxidoreductase [Solirubrobacteraceae bacterium]
MRLVLGGFFIGHGTQKLFGWFGGHGLEGTGQFFEGSLNLRPGKHHALAAGLGEAGGGTLVLLGAATPLGAAALIGTMLTAINRVHLKNGPWVSDGGYEYNVVLIAAALVLAETGPGTPSIDGDKTYGNKGALIALLLGAAGAAGAHAYAESQPAPATPPAPAPAPDTATAPAAV